MTNIEEELKNKLENLPSFFEGGEEELAYLLLTGKPEEHIRDKIAYRLQNENGYNTAREWVSEHIDNKRFDLTILNEDGAPQTVVEFKLGLSVDMLADSDKENILGGLISDIKKLKEVEKEHETCNQAMAILLMVHPHQNPKAGVDDMIKYSNKFCRLENKDESEVKEWRKKLEGYNKMGEYINKHLTGEAVKGKEIFETKIDLLYWIMPVRNKV